MGDESNGGRCEKCGGDPNIATGAAAIGTGGCICGLRVVLGPSWYQPAMQFGGVLLPVFALIATERERQRARWGDDSHPHVGDGWWRGVGDHQRALARTEDLRALVEAGKASDGGAGWLEILCEEVGEARDAAEMTGDGVLLLAANRRKRRAALRAELVQVAAVAVAWLEDLERRDAAEEGAKGDGE